MNPFNEHLKSYITACLTVAVIYAFAAGFNLPVFVRIVNGACFGIVLFSTGIVLWNIFRFAMPASHAPVFRRIFIVVLAFTTCALVAGIESLIIYLSFPSLFDAYVPTLPVRAFIAFLLFVICYLLYAIMDEDIKKQEGNSEEMSVGASATTEPGNAGIGNAEPGNAEPGRQPYADMPQTVDRITVRSGQKIKIIPVADILYVKADGDYVAIRTAEGSWLKEQTMKYTEDRLPISSFVRIHRSYIVNIHRISRIERYGEKRQVVLSNNEKIIISAARYHTLKQILGI